MTDDTTPARAQMSYLAFLRALPRETRPVYDQSVGGWIVPSRPALGVFRRSDGEALDALAAEFRIELRDEAA